MRFPALVGALALLTACSSSAAQQKQPSPGDVVATVGSTSITLAQVDQRALEQPAGNFGSVKLSQALYEARRAAVDELVANALIDQEAKTRGMDRSALIEQEITSKVTPVTDTDISTFYDANRARVQGATLDQVRQPIRAYLTQERVQRVREQYLDTLKAKTNVRVLLDPPRQQVSAAKGETKGPANAPIELIEFSDFQCPFCQRANPTVDQVLATYGDRIHFVYRHFPLPSHPNARPAAEASQCAAEQGKFWAYHDKLFANPSRLSEADLKQQAAELGMDSTKFNACVDSHKYKDQIDTDVQAGEAAGVNGTPAFFINGRMINGALPFSEFKRVIDEELELKKTR
ncbi:MAG TPA: thioredoxin domain-containing protein [Rhodanobacteraceae bacterium]